MITAKAIYRETEAFPDSERFGLTNQLRRASVSISANIAEGHGRRTNPDFARHLRIALGSTRECQSLIELSFELGYVGEFNDTDDALEEIARMLYGLIKKLETS